MWITAANNKPHPRTTRNRIRRRSQPALGARNAAAAVKQKAETEAIDAAMNHWGEHRRRLCA